VMRRYRCADYTMQII